MIGDAVRPSLGRPASECGLPVIDEDAARLVHLCQSHFRLRFCCLGFFMFFLCFVRAVCGVVVCAVLCCCENCCPVCCMYWAQCCVLRVRGVRGVNVSIIQNRYLCFVLSHHLDCSDVCSVHSNVRFASEPATASPESRTAQHLCFRHARTCNFMFQSFCVPFVGQAESVRSVLSPCGSTTASVKRATLPLRACHCQYVTFCWRARREEGVGKCLTSL